MVLFLQTRQPSAGLVHQRWAFFSTCMPLCVAPQHTLSRPYQPLAWADFGWSFLLVDVPDTFLMLPFSLPPIYHRLLYRWRNWGSGRQPSCPTGPIGNRRPSGPSSWDSVVPALISKFRWPIWWPLSIGFPWGLIRSPGEEAQLGVVGVHRGHGRARPWSSLFQEEVQPPQACFLWLVFQGHIDADFEDKELSWPNFPKERFPNNKDVQSELWKCARRN